jgi:abequosyltransferase
MYDKDLISFCIPTYNRSAELKIIVEDLIANIRVYAFTIVISDNCSTDDTENVVNQLRKEYKNIFYKRQETNIGPDRNFQEVLHLSKSVYSWLLGDTYLVEKSNLIEVVDLLKTQKYDAVFLGSEGRFADISSKEYFNSTDLLREIGWHIQIMSCLIFKKQLIEQANFQRYYDSFFIQNGIIFEYLENNKNAICYWYANPIISNIPKESGWIKTQSLYVFGQKWSEYVLSLPPSIPLEVKLSCIKNHGIKSKIFSLKSLVNFRAQGNITVKQFHKYNLYLFLNTRLSTYLMSFLIMYLPKFIFKAIMQVNNLLKGKS